MADEASLAFYKKYGYMLLENFASADECAGMIKQMEMLVDNFDPSTISIFSTKNQVQYIYGGCDFKILKAVLLKSLEKTCGLLSAEKAFDSQGKLRQPKSLSINKVGHALHDLDPVFRKFSRSEKFAKLLDLLGYCKPLPVQSMYIFKQPGIGGEVVPHQDNSFLFTNPPSCTGLWLALEDANVQNGCLWALPGSHEGQLARRMTKDGDGIKFDREPPEYDFSQFEPLEVKAGTLVVIHGNLVHQSFENQSNKSRHAYTFHVVEGEGCVWAKDNWLERAENFPFEPLQKSSENKVQA